MIVFLTTAWHRWPTKALTDGTFGFEIPACSNVRYDTFFRQTTCPVATYVFTDHERLSSWEAERQLEEQFGRRSKLSDSASKKKPSEKFSVDSMAAAIILREYLERRAATAKGAGE